MGKTRKVQLLGTIQGAVSYQPQTLTNEEKAQARANIGAISADEIPSGVTEDRVNELIAEALSNMPQVESMTFALEG